MNPRVYVASLSDYNAGRLVGGWFDAVDADVLRENVSNMLKSEGCVGAEEYAIHDYEGFGSIRVGEYNSLSYVCKLGALIVEHGEAFSYWVTEFEPCSDVDDWGDEFVDSFQGEFKSWKEFVYSYVDCIGLFEGVDGPLELYFDYELFGRDLRHDYVCCEPSWSVCYVFGEV